MLFVLFFVLPLVELWLLIIVGGAIGGFVTILWVIFSALLGISMLRAVGMGAAHNLTDPGMVSSDPPREWLSTMLLLLGGLLLIIPGLITDALGLLCLFTPTRNYLIDVAPYRSSVSAVFIRYSSRIPFQSNETRGNTRDTRDHPPPDNRTIDSDWHSDEDEKKR